MITLFRKKKQASLLDNERPTIHSVVVFTYPLVPETEDSEWSGGIVLRGHHNPLPKTYSSEEEAVEALREIYNIANSCTMQEGEVYGPFMPISLYSSNEAESYVSSFKKEL